MDEQRLIMVVEDDEATGRFVGENPATDGFRTATATSAEHLFVHESPAPAPLGA